MAIRFLFLMVTAFALVIGKPEYKDCSPSKETCEYWFVVREKLTMIYKQDLVIPHDGKLFKYDDKYRKTEIPIDQVVTADGANRMVIAVNETVPGPPIVVYEHQKLVIHVKNLLLSDSVTIHWHGLHQKGTPFMDGVGYITQCPIASGQTFTYKFKAEPSGTFWYHSHVGAQRTNGLFGALIIKERPEPGVTPPVDMIMQVGDWHHDSSEEVYMKMVYGNYLGLQKYVTTKTLDGANFSGVPWVSGLIEGKGRYKNPDTGIEIKAPLTEYNVIQGKTYRFRVINVGTIYPLRVSVDQHEISVVATDGFDLKPVTVESLVINPGERYDFLLVANGTVGNYWIRSNSMEDSSVKHTSEAILRYNGANVIAEPTSKRRNCSITEPCIVVNCPFKIYPVGTHTKCLTLGDLQGFHDNDPAPVFMEDSEEHFLNFAFPGTTVKPGAVNGRKFEFPGVNSFTQGDEIGNYDCDKQNCGVDKVCYCHYQLKIPFGKTIQMVWTNMGSGAGWGHPIHLHGHSFYVLKMEYPPQHSKTAKLAGDASGISCGVGGLNFCNAPAWKNSSWKGGNIPGLNLKNPPRKDTLIIPTGGYAVLRIRSNNPGKWFMHCHIEVHSLDGMAMILTEAEDKFPTPPKGFPVCQNFYNDNSRDISYIKESKKCSSGSDGAASLNMALVIVILMHILSVNC